MVVGGDALETFEKTSDVVVVAAYTWTIVSTWGTHKKKWEIKKLEIVKVAHLERAIGFEKKKKRKKEEEICTQSFSLPVSSK